MLTHLIKASLPASLHHVTAQSLNIIDSATDFQLSKATTHSKREIDALLLKLLAITFINNNQTKIENEIKSIDIVSDDHDQSRLKTYCAQILKHHLSPAIGFINKNLFVKYNISEDISVDIISYLKPMEIYKSIICINKHLNKIV